MTFAFDLISDLHVESWPDFDWTHQPTAPYCVVAGDVGKDRDRVLKTLKHLAGCYAGVFYIDGNDEHRQHYQDIASSYRDLDSKLTGIDGVVWLQNNVVIIDGVAIVAVNGWWSYEFDSLIDPEESMQWFENYLKVPRKISNEIVGMALHDAAYLRKSIQTLQTHRDVHSIVVVSHTVPNTWLTEHDIELSGHARYNTLGNQHLSMAIEQDTERKIKTWCFGHYHNAMDRTIADIRYVNNSCGRRGTPWCQQAYYPKRIEIA